MLEQPHLRPIGLYELQLMGKTGSCMAGFPAPLSWSGRGWRARRRPRPLTDVEPLRIALVDVCF
jgi:hypothetical protein